jgi:hypothetical protein
MTRPDVLHPALLHHNSANSSEYACLGLMPNDMFYNNGAPSCAYQVQSPVHHHLQIELHGLGYWGNDLMSCNIEIARTDWWITPLALQHQSASFGCVGDLATST